MNTSLETGYFRLRLPSACSLVRTQAALLNLNSKCDLESLDCNSDLCIHPWYLWSEKYSRGLMCTECLQEQINRPHRDLNLCWLLISLSLPNTPSPFYVQPLKLIRVHFSRSHFFCTPPQCPQHVCMDGKHHHRCETNILYRRAEFNSKCGDSTDYIK